MTPEEKAIELMNKFYIMNESTAGHITLGMGKQCALICVFELWHDCDDNLKEIYWQEVKEEINKL